MTERAKIGFGAALGDLDSFTPSSRRRSAIPKPEAAAAGFTSREPTSVPTPAAKQRRRRTGRNAQINIKATPETIARFYAAADTIGCGIGEAFEVAVDLLSQKLSDS